MLQPNHSHFILIDDGSEGHFGKEIDFRNDFETELRKGRNLRYYQEKEKSNKSNKLQTRNSFTKNVSFASSSHVNCSEMNEDDVSEEIPMVIIRIIMK